MKAGSLLLCVAAIACPANAFFNGATIKSFRNGKIIFDFNSDRIYLSVLSALNAEVTIQLFNVSQCQQ